MENYAAQIKALKEERAGKLASLDTLVNKMSTEKRGFTDAEQSEYDKAKGEVESIDKRLEVLVETEKRNRDEVRFIPGAHNTDSGAGERTERSKMLKEWSFKRALSAVVNRTPFNGVEAELDKDMRAEMRESGITPSPGSVLVPFENFSKREKRDMDATTATAGPSNQGSYTIQTDVEGIVDVFLPEMTLGRLPVVRMNGLKGNVQFPQGQTLPSAGWNTENGTATEKTPLLNKLNLSPKRLAAKIQMSNQLLIQSEANIAAYCRRFLVKASAIEFEKVCLKGGGSNEPTGIIGGTGYTTLYAGDAVNNAVNANGSRLVWADWVKLNSSIKALNSPDGQAYITSPAMKGRAQQTPKQSAGIEGNFILPGWNQGINGFPVYATTNLPDTFTKGGSTVLSAVIFGDFSNFVTASWGGMEIGVDPYTNMAEGMTNLVLGSYVDCGMLNPAAFSVIKDAQSY